MDNIYKAKAPMRIGFFGGGTDVSPYPAQYRGNYFFADYGQEWLRRIIFDANGNVADVKTFATTRDAAPNSTTVPWSRASDAAHPMAAHDSP